MAIDKSKENVRIEQLKALSEEDLELLCSVGINNPAILKQFISEDDFKWEYAVAAGLLDWDDVAFIKAEEEQNKEENDTETPKNENPQE